LEPEFPSCLIACKVGQSIWWYGGTSADDVLGSAISMRPSIQSVTALQEQNPSTQVVARLGTFFAALLKRYWVQRNRNHAGSQSDLTRFNENSDSSYYPAAQDITVHRISSAMDVVHSMGSPANSS
jgi:hypothetical protein